MKHPAYDSSEPRFFRRVPGEAVRLTNDVESCTGRFLRAEDKATFVRYDSTGSPIVQDLDGVEWAIPWSGIEGGS